jgi:hypothetical protein
MMEEDQRQHILKLFVRVCFGLSLAVSCFAKDAVTRGDFGDFGISLSQKPEAYQIIKDPTGEAPTATVEKFTVHSGDCGVSAEWSDCKNDRERVELGEKGRTNRDGETYWYGWSIYFPKDYPLIFPVKVALGQFHQEQGSPLWMFQQLEEGYLLEAVFLDADKKFLLISDKDLRGVWHKIEIQVLWSQKAKGFFRVWVDGIQKVNYKGPTKQKTQLYFKYGLYRSFLSRYGKPGAVPAQEVYFSNVKRARTRAKLGTP